MTRLDPIILTPIANPTLARAAHAVAGQCPGTLKSSLEHLILQGQDTAELEAAARTLTARSTWWYDRPVGRVSLKGWAPDEQPVAVAAVIEALAGGTVIITDSEYLADRRFLVSWGEQAARAQGRLLVTAAGSLCEADVPRGFNLLCVDKDLLELCWIETTLDSLASRYGTDPRVPCPEALLILPTNGLATSADLERLDGVITAAFGAWRFVDGITNATHPASTNSINFC